MENSKKDSDTLSCQSSTETLFLEQVKECQYHLRCMEKLFFDLQKLPENEKHFKQSQFSLNDTDLQLLVEELDIQLSPNKIFKEACNRRSQIEPINNISSLTFIVQVPNSVLNSLKKKVRKDNFSELSLQYLKKYELTSHKKVGFLQRLFKRKRNNQPESANGKILHSKEFLQFLQDNSDENISVASKTVGTNHSEYKSVNNSYYSEKKTVCDNSTNTETSDKLRNLEESQTLILPGNCNKNEEPCNSVVPNIMIQHEVIHDKPGKSSHSIKILNEILTEDSDKSSTTIENKIIEQKSQSNEISQPNVKHETQITEMLLETLIKTLNKTVESLSNLEGLKVFIEKLNKKEIKIKKIDQNNRNFKIKSSKEFRSLNHSMQNVTLKSTQETVQQSLNKQSSKLSVCSTAATSSTDGCFYKSPISSKCRHSKRRARYHSPSMLNYLVCQSERDIDQRMIN